MLQEPVNSKFWPGTYSRYNAATIAVKSATWCEGKAVERGTDRGRSRTMTVTDERGNTLVPLSAKHSVSLTNQRFGNAGERAP